MKTHVSRAKVFDWLDTRTEQSMRSASAMTKSGHPPSPTFHPKSCNPKRRLGFRPVDVTSSRPVRQISPVGADRLRQGKRVMDFRHLSDGIDLQNGHYGHGAITPSLPSINFTPQSVIDTGDNSAGNGGSGYFFGSLVHSPVVIYMPINIAVAGYNATADAEQSNTVQFDQSVIQVAGMGGDGGNNNLSIGGNVVTSGVGSSESGAISSGSNQAGNGGDSFFFGSIIHASFVLYHPINISVAGPNSSAHADQTNNVDINQSADQMAGIGGNGGDGNAALGGDVSSHSGSGLDAINTGNNSAGNGGSGYFFGSLVDSPVVIYMPINIAIAGYNSTADAQQSNTALFDQSAIQIAGV